MTATVLVGDDSAAGRFTDEAAATATCDGGPVTGRTDVVTAVDLTGRTVLAEPEVVPGASGTAPAADVQLPRTGGGAFAGLAGLGLIGLAAGLRRRSGGLRSPLE